MQTTPISVSKTRPIDKVSSKKKLISEVVIMRPFAIFLVVIYHSFCYHNGNWPIPANYEVNEIYAWFVKFVYGAMLETFTLVSGYIFAYQSITLQRKTNFKKFATKKFTRLYIPCFCFGLVYYLMFYTDNFTPAHFVSSLIGGPGHLWFLPMIFFCYLGLWIIDKYQPNPVATFLTLGAFSIIGIPLPLGGISSVPHYLFFCYCGYLLWIYRDKVIAKSSPLTSLLFFALYIALIICRDNIPAEIAGYSIFSTIISNGLLSLYALCGILSLFLIVTWLTEKNGFTPPNWIIYCSSICYGVYIFQQFILKYLFYHTSLPIFSNTIVLPWIGLVITILLSAIFSHYLLKTKLGKFLIG